MRQLQNNLEEFGLVDPIIINLRNNRIIGGHQRYTALENNYKRNKQAPPELNLIKLGDIGWVFENRELKIEDEVHEKALNLSLNKISGEWDYDKLGLLFDDLTETQFDLGLTGFDSFEIEQIIIPNDLKQQFKEVEDIKEGKAEATYNEEENTDKNNSSENTESDSDDETLFTEDEVNKMTQYKCPKCGYEW